MTVGVQTSGHTIHAAHIEQPDLPFCVAWDTPAYTNVLRFPASRRWVRVLAETAEGALRVARYHYFRGRNFTLLAAPPSAEVALPV